MRNNKSEMEASSNEWTTTIEDTREASKIKKESELNSSQFARELQTLE